MFIKNRRAQSVMEYALMVAAVVVALIAMSTYLSRAQKGKIKEQADRLGMQFEANLVHKNWVSHSDGETISKETAGFPELGGRGSEIIQGETRRDDIKRETWGQ